MNATNKGIAPDHLRRSIDVPPRNGLTWDELWNGPDKGLVWCWERGRQKRLEAPDLAARAKQGELVILAWDGGVGEKLKVERKRGTLEYLATWQGLRGQDLEIPMAGTTIIECTRTGQKVEFGRALTD